MMPPRPFQAPRSAWAIWAVWARSDRGCQSDLESAEKVCHMQVRRKLDRAGPSWTEQT